MTKKKEPVEKLEPPDLKQCQCMKPNGNTFMTFGGRPGYVQCEEKPVYIATENKPSEDGQIGSMSLCAKCAVKLMQAKGSDFATLEEIEDD